MAGRQAPRAAVRLEKPRLRDRMRAGAEGVRRNRRGRSLGGGRQLRSEVGAKNHWPTQWWTGAPSVEINNSYLKTQITQEAVEALYDFPNTLSEFQNDWNRLLEKKRDGDELWTFEPPPGHFRVWGVALVRGDRVISTLIEAVD